jgi:hypothetical protein
MRMALVAFIQVDGWSMALPPSPPGLVNGGQFCYSNTTLQVAVPGVLAYTELATAHALVCAQGPAVCIVKAASKLLSQLAAPGPAPALSVPPVLRLADLFGADQQDANDFHLALQQRLDDHCNFTGGPKLDVYNILHHEVSRGDSIDCQHVTLRRVDVADKCLTVTLPPLGTERITLELQLRHALSWQHSDDAGVYCQECGCCRPVSRRTRLLGLPMELVLNIVRGLDGGEKDGRFVRFDSKLDMGKYIVPTPAALVRFRACGGQLTAAGQPVIIYNLSGAVVHLGRTVNSGHYVHFSRRNDTWTHGSDTVVTNATLRRVLRAQAYNIRYRAEKPELVRAIWPTPAEYAQWVGVLEVLAREYQPARPARRAVAAVVAKPARGNVPAVAAREAVAALAACPALPARAGRLGIPSIPPPYVMEDVWNDAGQWVAPEVPVESDEEVV